jgi:4,5-DOPA dioxygenase extradiol
VLLHAGIVSHAEPGQNKDMNRRDAIFGLAGAALGAGACLRDQGGRAGGVKSRANESAKNMTNTENTSASNVGGGNGTQAPVTTPEKATGKSAAVPAVMPAIFLAHGYPLWSFDRARIADLNGWAQALPRPRAVLVISAHWEARPISLGAIETVPLVYDFSGFPEELYRFQYPAPGAPALASRVAALLTEAKLPFQREPRRGLDHGAYVPLQMMYPEADVPILQISLPSLEPVELLAVGRALAPLRAEGFLIVGSGFLTHNLRRFDPRPDAVTPPWAQEFDAWTAEGLARRDVDAVMQYRKRAPGVDIALPTHEHFAPVVVALGTSIDRAEAVSFPVTGWEAGSLTRRSVQFG